MTFTETLDLLAAAVDDGITTPRAAARMLAEHAGGRITAEQAARALANHRIGRRLAAQLADVRALLAAVEAVEAAGSEAERVRARANLRAEIALQRAADVERVRRRPGEMLQRDKPA